MNILTRIQFIPCIILFALLCKSAAAQNKLPVTVTPEKNKDSSYFKAEISYLSNALYNGRKDSLPVPYLNPSIGYYHKSGLYIKSTLSYLVSNYAQRIDLVQIEGGYNYVIGTNFIGSISANKDFYNKYSVSVKSEIKGSLDANFSYKAADIVQINGGVSYIFTSAHSDFVFNGGISHDFYWGTNQEWSFAPSILTNFGTQYYYDQYKQRRQVKTGKKSKLTDSTTTVTSGGTVTTTTTITALNPNKFVLLDYEFSLPVYYDRKKWGLFFTPAFAIPVNPATYVTTINTRKVATNGTITRTKNTSNSIEPLSNSFYAEAGFYLKF